jgi:two-component system CheB/CheR fusion protein
MNEDDTQSSGPDRPTDPATANQFCPIVGIGASAGGIQALRRLFPHVRQDCRMAFVIVLHLDPGHASELTGIIARISALPVTEIVDDTLVQANHVYVIPPNASLTIREGRLRLAEPVVPRPFRNTIDEFFISLANDHADHAACVVLSGTGSDGTIGLRAVKEAGGLTLAQAGAEYDGMMRSAVATGLVDFVLPVEEIPLKLEEYFTRLAEDGHGIRSDPEFEMGDQLSQVITILRNQTGHDFSGYKDRTLVRRVRRRMHVLQIEGISAFIERLRRDPRETNLLFQDLLIGVTNFFRDPDAFALLEAQVIPELIQE